MEAETNAPKTSSRRDVYAIVTGRIIDLLSQGIAPWRKPWADGGVPRNLISKRPYRGINTMLLAFMGYEHNLFLTFKQAQNLGASIRKGERAHMVVFWNFVERKAGPGEKADPETGMKKSGILRYYFVYNISQCEGIPEKYLPKETRVALPQIPICEDIVKNMPQCPTIRHKERSAFYNPLLDFVNMPKYNTFEKPEGYYATLFHELVHSTGHGSRLNRKDLLQMSEFGSENYSHEELVAEIGTCYLLSFAGISSEMEQSAAYIQGWLKALKNDPRFIFSASSHAQKATDFILNIPAEAISAAIDNGNTAPKNPKPDSHRALFLVQNFNSCW